MSYRNEGIHKDTIRDACPAGTEGRLFMEKEAHYFDAILMDIVMPKMDGFEAARQIRRVPHKDAQMIPIIAMSAKDAREDMDACKEAGMNDYLAKPVEPQRLYQVLAEYLENPM